MTGFHFTKKNLVRACLELLETEGCPR